jgi:hypothetical protein
MSPRCRDRAVALAAWSALASALVVSPAGADGANPPSKTECAKANADAQALRMEGKLAAGRTELELCQSPSCPAIVRDDCAQRMDDLERAQPTIVFDVKDTAGTDVSAAAVTVDGQPLSSKLTGSALRVDPGEHTFVVTADGHPPVTRRLVIKEGEKDRREVVALGSLAPSPSPSPVSASGTAGATQLGSRRILGLTAGGAGIAAFAVGGIFGAETFSAVSQQNSACANSSHCTSPHEAESAHSSAVTDSTVSTAMFIAGGVLLAGGALLFFTAPRASQESAGLLVLPSLDPSGGGVTLRGSF